MARFGAGAPSDPSRAEPGTPPGRPGGMKPIALLAAACALVLAACSAAASPSPTPAGPPGPEPTVVPGTSPSPGAAGTLLLEIVDGGGLVPEYVPLVQLPAVAVYADGSMITQGPMIEIHPGPALPNLQLTRLSADGLARIATLARVAGLTGPDRTLQAPGILDAPATIFSAMLDGAEHRTVATALGSESSLDIPPQERATREALLALRRELTDIRSVPGAVVGDEAPYEWSALRVVAMTGPPALDPAAPAVAMRWPLEPGLGALGTAVEAGVRCGVVSGDDLAGLRPLLEQATELTPWVSAGVEYTLHLRPLLPHESGCERAF